MIGLSGTKALTEEAFPEAFWPLVVQECQNAAFGAVEAFSKILHGIRQMALMLFQAALPFLHHGKFFFQISYTPQCFEIWGQSCLLRIVALPLCATRCATGWKTL
ncbi:hypothetical protein [Sedimentimonas flavescens]|uniref:hypothetical protein n=1 Tax=Sedimentimonas flavescens TaxID=2851012 RepID=UPI0021A28589|nr:hypothetical protein [Sedimentimonas flavescens]MCT2541257.1 hypothetical protein [Sedimentimonas flavescens]